MIGTTAALIAAGIGAAGSIGSAAISSRAAGKAAGQQQQSLQQAIDIQQPYLDLGNQSVKQLMEAFNSGTFGPGSIPRFSAPSLAEARTTPGYEFTLEQGMRGVNAGAAARGASLGGGTLKALSRFNTGLADTTYGDIFDRALRSYSANLAGQGQEFGQLMSVADVGRSAAGSIGNNLAGIGNAQAAGTVGSANAWNAGIGGAANSITQGILLNQLMKQPYTPNWSTNDLQSLYGPATPPFVGVG